MMFKYSYDSLVYYGEPVRNSIERVAKFGYDAIELVGEPDSFDPAEVNQLCEDNNIVVSSICSAYTAERDLAHPDAKIRQKAMDYVKKVADFASAVSCPMMIIGPTAVCKTTPLAPFEDEHKWGVEGIIKGGEYAAQRNVNLCIEPWNRYETYWLNRLDQALELCKEVNLPNVGVMGDTFHMCIEEQDLAQAFIDCGKYLTHVHFADSNRAAPGKGHLDFVPLLKALQKIDYKGYIVFEILPAAADPFATLKSGGGREFFDEYTELSIKTLKEAEASL